MRLVSGLLLLPGMNAHPRLNSGVGSSVPLFLWRFSAHKGAASPSSPPLGPLSTSWGLFVCWALRQQLEQPSHPVWLGRCVPLGGSSCCVRWGRGHALAFCIPVPALLWKMALRLQGRLSTVWRAWEFIPLPPESLWSVTNRCEMGQPSAWCWLGPW